MSAVRVCFRGPGRTTHTFMSYNPSKKKLDESWEPWACQAKLVFSFSSKTNDVTHGHKSVRIRTHTIQWMARTGPRLQPTKRLDLPRQPKQLLIALLLCVCVCVCLLSTSTHHSRKCAAEFAPTLNLSGGTCVSGFNLSSFVASFSACMFLFPCAYSLCPMSNPNT